MAIQGGSWFKTLQQNFTCRSAVKGAVYIPPDETVITRVSGAAFSNKGTIDSVMAKVPNTFTAKFNSNLE